ncbi:hypothetical protein V1478_017433 [Vespula squamosa]|uniref:Uncharacterized protein n=1 Tax=Vespula squamosa TaxID=30214 RepID=A0ABD1ZXB7_VESSQ
MMRKLSSIYKTFMYRLKFRSSYVFQEKEAYESEDSKEIEKMYAYIKAEQVEREKKLVKVEKEYSDETIETMTTKPKKQIPSKLSRKITAIAEKSERTDAMLDEEMVESEESIQKKGRKRRALSEIPLKTCFMDICEPEICCADIVKAEKERKKLEREKKLTLFIKDLPYKKKLSIGEWQQKILELCKGIPEPTEQEKKKILSAIAAPPDVLTKNVKDAKKYLKEWQHSLIFGRSPSYRSRSMPPMRRMKHEIDDDKEKKKEDELVKKRMDVYEEKSPVSLEPALEISCTLEESISPVTEDEKRLYPRISAYSIR